MSVRWSLGCARALAVLMLLVVAACAGQNARVLEAPQTNQQFRSVTVQPAPDTPAGAATETANLFRGLLENRFAERRVPQGNDLTATYRIVSFDPGDRFVRWAVSFGAGAGKMTVEVAFTDKTGRQVGKIQNDGRIDMGFFGGDSDLMVRQVAEKVVEYAVETFRLPNGAPPTTNTVGPIGTRRYESASGPYTSPAPIPTAPPAPVTSPTGTTFRNVFELGGVQVPLLDGTWMLAGTGSGGTGSAASLVRIEQGKLWGIIRAWHGTPSRGSPVFGQCGRTDILFTAVTTNTDHGDQDCWTVNHALLAQSRTEQKEPHQTQSYAFLDERGVTVGEGLTVITSIHRVAMPGGYLTIWYQVNPEFFGFAPSNAASWRESEWQRDHIGADPKRVAFVERFKAFHAGYQDHVKAGFRRQLDAFTPQPLAIAAARLPQFATAPRE